MPDFAVPGEVANELTDVNGLMPAPLSTAIQLAQAAAKVSEDAAGRMVPISGPDFGFH